MKIKRILTFAISITILATLVVLSPRMKVEANSEEEKAVQINPDVYPDPSFETVTTLTETDLANAVGGDWTGASNFTVYVKITSASIYSHLRAGGAMGEGGKGHKSTKNLIGSGSTVRGGLSSNNYPIQDDVVGSAGTGIYKFPPVNMNKYLQGNGPALVGDDLKKIIITIDRGTTDVTYEFLGIIFNNGASWNANAPGSAFTEPTCESTSEFETPSNHVTVTFDSQGGSAVVKRIVTRGATLGILPASTREGHEFLGWYDSPSGGAKISSNTVINGNITFYAQWKANATSTCTVTFDSQEGSAVDAVTVNRGDAIGALPEPTREGYEFLGWFTAPTDGEHLNASTVITESVTYYAQWRQTSNPTPSCTVTFDSQGGSAIESKTIPIGDAVGTLPNPTRTGYEFLGWYTASTEGTMITATTIIAGNVTYYARWKETAPSDCTVTFNDNGAITSKAINHNDAVGDLIKPTKTGYTFKGWYTAISGGEKISSTTTITSNVTFYARWTVTKPGKPSKPIIKKVTKNKVTLKWKRVANATGYEIQRSKKSAKKGFKNIATIAKGKTVTFTNKKLKSGSAYYYRIRAINKQGLTTARSSYTQAVTVKTKNKKNGNIERGKR